MNSFLDFIRIIGFLGFIVSAIILMISALLKKPIQKLALIVVVFLFLFLFSLGIEVFFVFIGIIGFFYGLIYFGVSFFWKKSLKKSGVIILVSIVLFIIGLVLPPSPHTEELIATIEGIEENEKLSTPSEEYAVVVSVFPKGSAIVDGSGFYKEGEEVTVTVETDKSYRFLKWTMDNNVMSENEEFTFTVREDINLLAILEPVTVLEYEISISLSPEDAGKITGDGYYKEGSLVAIIAEPKEGYEFIQWVDKSNAGGFFAGFLKKLSGSDNVLSAESNYSFHAKNDLNLVAEFARLPVYDVSVSVAPKGSGIITGSREYQEGEEVTLNAKALEGYIFDQWTDETGDVISSDRILSFSATENFKLIAEFMELPRYEVTVSALPKGVGVTYGSGKFMKGEMVTVEVEFVEGYHFKKWIDEKGNVLSSDKEYSFRVLKDHILIPEYKYDYSVQEVELTREIELFIDNFFFFNDMNFDYVEKYTVNMNGIVAGEPDEVYFNVHMSLEKWEEIRPEEKVHISWFARAIFPNLVYLTGGVDYFIDEVRIITKDFMPDEEHIKKLLLTGIEIKPIPPTDFFLTGDGELYVIYETWFSRSDWEKRR